MLCWKLGASVNRSRAEVSSSGKGLRHVKAPDSKKADRGVGLGSLLTNHSKGRLSKDLMIR
jgi:hypothetical protein